MENARLARRIGLITVVAFAIDRISKFWVIEMLDLQNAGRIDVFSPYLTFLMGWNRGINFGLLDGMDMRWFLVGLAVAISIVLTWWIISSRKDAASWGAGLVVGGALSNAWDRVQYGAVADFLNMSCCGIQNPYAFNTADVAIFLGAVWIAIKA